MRHLAVEADRAVRGRELDGVVQQVGDRLLDQLAVAAGPQVGTELDLEMDPLLLGDGAVQLGEVGQQRRRVHGDEGGASGAGST